MNAEDLGGDNGRDGQCVEDVDESLPDLDVDSSFAFVVESINARDIGTLVIATKQEEVFGILDLVAEQKQDGFERLLASIDVVTEEKVVGRWWKSAHLEQAEQVVVLTVGVTDNLDGWAKLDQCRLREGRSRVLLGRRQ